MPGDLTRTSALMALGGDAILRQGGFSLLLPRGTAGQLPRGCPGASTGWYVPSQRQVQWGGTATTRVRTLQLVVLDMLCLGNPRGRRTGRATRRSLIG